MEAGSGGKIGKLPPAINLEAPGGTREYEVAAVHYV